MTWNYDEQFELAARQFQSSIRVLSKGVTNYNAKDNGFRVFRLNGVAACVCPKKKQVAKSDQESPLGRVYEVASELLDQFESGISYAWEQIDSGGIVSSAIDAAKDTDILVVIGYSFPFFNRQIDRQILAGMELDDIYIQDFPDPGRAAYDRFLASAGYAIVVLTSYSQINSTSPTNLIKSGVVYITIMVKVKDVYP